MMRDKREYFFIKRIVPMLLAVCLFLQITIPVEAGAEKSAFEIYVITESGSFIGEFLICDGKVYADTDTVEQMTGLEYTMVLMEEGTAGHFFDETRDISVYDEELITYVTGKSGWYVPFSKIAEETGSYFSFQPEEKVLMIKMGSDMSELKDQLRKYKTDSSYKIASWRKRFFFKTDEYELEQADKIEQDLIYYVESMQDITEVIVETNKKNLEKIRLLPKMPKVKNSKKIF